MSLIPEVNLTINKTMSLLPKQSVMQLKRRGASYALLLLYLYNAIYQLNQKYYFYFSLSLLLIVVYKSLQVPIEFEQGPGLINDKLLHLMAYFVCSVPVLLSSCQFKKRFLFGIVLLSAGIEILQPYVGRTQDLVDLLSNASGVLSAYLCCSKFPTIVAFKVSP